MTKIHLDTDIGGDMDDLCALAMLLKWPDLEITGVTTVSEEQSMRHSSAFRWRGDLQVVDHLGFQFRMVVRRSYHR